MDSVAGGRPWQRPDRSDPVLPGPGQGLATLALLCALLAPASWLAVACAFALAVDGQDATGGTLRVVDLLGLAVTTPVALLVTGALLVLLRRESGLRRPVGTVAVVASVLMAPALALAWPG
ncbi:hypothetical protein AB0C04_29940 [Micromonospora sp. NPDC048909]|uniref:hypothetical protein n=1 Tax=Micromonospora sp. NPDC048909 TaxID=3155643 RepID=UPI0033D16B48